MPVHAATTPYRQCLDYLYGLQRFGIKLGLENIRALLAATGHPERVLRSIHVAGSNGKGSVCAFLAAIFRRANLPAGLYTSPHLHDFGERLQVDGVPASEAEIVALTDELRSAAEAIPATFFEFTTAMALLHFARRRVAWAILETGMGGRLDATNAVTPEVSVITPICRDHTRHLGREVTAIAAEKAGIIKPGVPVLCAPQIPEVLAVLERRAAEVGAPCYVLGRDFQLAETSRGLAFRGFGTDLQQLQSGLAGRHQYLNLGLALGVVALLRRQGVSLPDAALRSGAAGACWPGRLEWWGRDGRILLDGAHNEGGARALAAYLEEFPRRRIRWVAGLKADKDPAALLAAVLPRANALYCCAPPIDEALAPATLAAAAAPVPASVHGEVGEALKAALADQQGEELVLVAGSLFLVAAARGWLAQHYGTEAAS